jgi:Protein of unknown function (DUF3187)
VLKNLPVIVNVFFSIFFLISSSAFAFEGPLQAKNQFPLFLYVNPPRLESALTENSIAAVLSHSSVFMVKGSPEWSVNLDMEITELALRFKRDIPNFFEIGVEVPFVSFESGFMDGFLDSYHKAFGFADYGRSGRPENEFLYEVKRNGSTVVRGKAGRIGIGDMRITAKRVILGGDPVVSVRAELQLPTGDATEGFGSGTFGGGATLLVDKKLSKKFMSYWNIGAVFPGELKARETVSLRNFLHGGTAIEAALWEKFSILGQVEFQTSPFPKTGIGAIDRISALLSFGGRYVSGNNNVEFSITEDPNTAGAPDVTFTLTYLRRF